MKNAPEIDEKEWNAGFRESLDSWRSAPVVNRKVAAQVLDFIMKAKVGASSMHDDAKAYITKNCYQLAAFLYDSVESVYTIELGMLPAQTTTAISEEALRQRNDALRALDAAKERILRLESELEECRKRA